MQGDLKEVSFVDFCRTCRHVNVEEDNPEGACSECLEHPANQDSHKPVGWEARNMFAENTSNIVVADR